jgi:hypothetical protein
MVYAQAQAWDKKIRRELQLQIHVMCTGSCIARIHHHLHSARGRWSETTIMGCEWSEREVSGSRVKPTMPATVHGNYEFSIPDSTCRRDGKERS